MNFKKFVASLAISTMLVGSQAAISGAMEKSPKTEVSQKANSEGRGVVKTVLNVIPGLGGAYNAIVTGLICSGKVGPDKLPCVSVIVNNHLGVKSTFVMDGLLIVYSVAQFLV
jgi:hypothetical protein